MWVGSASSADHVRRGGHVVGRGVAGSGVAAGPGAVPALVDPATWLVEANGQPVAMAVEGCTGWRYVVEEITAAGFEAHVAEPADTQAARGRKHRAKTDRSDARLLRELLQRGELPESWIPPTVVLEWRERVRLYKSLVDQRLVWIQRIHAELFQHGVAVPEAAIRSAPTRAVLTGDEVALTPAARQRIQVGYTMIDATDAAGVAVEGAAAPLRDTPAGLSSAGRQPLRHRWAARGGGVVRARRLSTVLPLRTRRCATPAWTSRVDSSDLRRAGGYLSRQGPVDVALGVVRSSPQRLTPRQPRPRLLHGGEGTSRRQAGGDLRRPPVRSTLLPRAAQPRSRRRLRRSRPDLRRRRRPGSLISTSRVSAAVSSCHRRARQPSGWTAL